jgi:hypothetical protein
VLKKFPFLAFCWVGFALIVACGLLLLYLTYPRLVSIGGWAVFAPLAIIGIQAAVLGVGLALLTATSLSGVDFLYVYGRRSVTVRMLFPVALFLAKLIRYDRMKLMASFVEVNNSLTVARSARIKGERILVLLPHCLQIDICQRKVTGDLTNCLRCGKCPVGEFIEMGEKHDLKIEVVNGGTLARRRVAMWKPQGIIAVACERDLTLGILDVIPIPVYGVISDRPHGPCINTNVDMKMVDEAINFFKKNR